MYDPQRVLTVKLRTPRGEMPFALLDGKWGQGCSRDILQGRTYPLVPFIGDVRTIVDVGANVGAASLFFAFNYPEANLFAFEPCPATCRLLRGNLASLPGARVFDFGLFDRDCRTPLYLSRIDSITNSVGRFCLNTSQAVEVVLREAGAVLRELAIDRVDLLKVDTEGCELPILRSVAHLLPRVRVLYVEYHDEADRLEIDSLLRGTHILLSAKVHRPHCGELCYVAYDAFPARDTLEEWRIRGIPGPVPPRGDLRREESVGG